MLREFFQWFGMMEMEEEQFSRKDRSAMSSSAAARKVANNEFRNREFQSALSLYNFALIKAGDDKVQAALAYACRAAVYLEVGFYKHCLHNLDLAESHFPSEKISQIHDRRQKCLLLMQSKQDMELENLPDNFHQLSYEANPKLPFFINALELREDETFGRHLITTRDLKAGDVAAVIENPWIFPDTADIVVTNACYHCMKVQDLNLVTGEKCKGVLFCSKKCDEAHQKDVNHELFHLMESKKFPLKAIFTARVFLKMHEIFGSVDEMKKFVEMHKDEKRHTVFDFDWSDDPMNFKNIFLTILGMHYDDRTMQFLRDLLKTDNLSKWFIDNLELSERTQGIIMGSTEEHRDFVEGILLKIFNAHIWINFVSIGKNFTDDDERLPGYYFHPSKSLLNFSCDTNIYMYYENRKRIVWIVTQPIKAGGQLFVENYPAYYRHGRLTHGCPFKNNCVPCLKGWAKKIDPDKVMSAMRSNIVKFRGEIVTFPEKFTKGIQIYREICNEINQKHKNYETNAKVRALVASKIFTAGIVLEMMRDPFFPVFKD